MFLRDKFKSEEQLTWEKAIASLSDAIENTQIKPGALANYYATGSNNIYKIAFLMEENRAVHIIASDRSNSFRFKANFKDGALVLTSLEDDNFVDKAFDKAVKSSGLGNTIRNFINKEWDLSQGAYENLRQVIEETGIRSSVLGKIRAHDSGYLFNNESEAQFVADSINNYFGDNTVKVVENYQLDGEFGLWFNDKEILEALANAVETGDISEIEKMHDEVEKNLD